eukprot:gene3841-biopygen1498
MRLCCPFSPFENCNEPDRHDVRKTNWKGHFKVWKGYSAAVSDEMLSHGVGMAASGIWQFDSGREHHPRDFIRNWTCWWNRCMHTDEGGYLLRSLGASRAN